MAYQGVSQAESGLTATYQLLFASPVTASQLANLDELLRDQVGLEPRVRLTVVLTSSPRAGQPSYPQRILEEAKYMNEQEVDYARLEATDQEIRQVEGRQRRLVRLYVEGSIPEEILSSQSGELNNRRIALESNRRSLLESAPQAIDIKQLKERLPEVLPGFGSGCLNVRTLIWS